MLQWLADLRLDDMYFSLKSKVVVDAFNGASDDHTNFCSIISYRRQLFRNNFHNSKVEFSKRPTNSNVHELAQVSLLKVSPKLFDEVPPYIL